MFFEEGYTFVFDIETVPVCLESFPSSVQTYLLSYGEDRAKVQQQMALWAPTNRILAIGVYCMEKKQGAVYVDAGEEELAFEENGIRYVSGNEQFLLERFWEVMRYAKRFVTFNGRRFDCPVLLLRSALLGVTPSKQIMPPRYRCDTHVDLLEQFTFYGATRKFSLDVYCQFFGVPSPKEFMCGHDLLSYVEEKRFEEIARYCMGDVMATATLYERWRKYLSFS